MQIAFNYFLIFNRAEKTVEITNPRLAKYNAAAVKEFLPLSEKEGGFSFWYTPRYFVEAETVHHHDGTHFTWPETLGKVNLVI